MVKKRSNKQNTIKIFKIAKTRRICAKPGCRNKFEAENSYKNCEKCRSVAKKVNCEYCLKNISKKNYHQHLTACSAYKVMTNNAMWGRKKCAGCWGIFIKRNFWKHVRRCNGDQWRIYKTHCPFCDSYERFAKTEKHVCPKNNDVCQICGESYPIEKFQKHICNGVKMREVDKSFQCDYCLKRVKENYKYEHLLNCMSFKLKTLQTQVNGIIKVPEISEELSFNMFSDTYFFEIEWIKSHYPNDKANNLIEENFQIFRKKQINHINTLQKKVQRNKFYIVKDKSLEIYKRIGNVMFNQKEWTHIIAFGGINEIQTPMNEYNMLTYPNVCPVSKANYIHKWKKYINEPIETGKQILKMIIRGYPWEYIKTIFDNNMEEKTWQFTYNYRELYKYEKEMLGPILENPIFDNCTSIIRDHHYTIEEIIRIYGDTFTEKNPFEIIDKIKQILKKSRDEENICFLRHDESTAKITRELKYPKIFKNLRHKYGIIHFLDNHQTNVFSIFNKLSNNNIGYTIYSIKNDLTQSKKILDNMGIGVPNPDFNIKINNKNESRRSFLNSLIKKKENIITFMNKLNADLQNQIIKLNIQKTWLRLFNKNNITIQIDIYNQLEEKLNEIKYFSFPKYPESSHNILENTLEKIAKDKRIHFIEIMENIHSTWKQNHKTIVNNFDDILNFDNTDIETPNPNQFNDYIIEMETGIDDDENIQEAYQKEAENYLNMIIV